MRRRTIAAIVAAGILACIAPASASLTTYSFELPAAATNWRELVAVPRFDPDHGTLRSVEYTITANVGGSASFESHDPSATTVRMDVSAIIRLQRPDGSTLLTAIPDASVTAQAGPFDGVVDYSGSSGATFDSLLASVAQSGSTSSPADLALFIGTGDLLLPVFARGASTGSGAGNLEMHFSTLASAELSVTYVANPEPGSVGLILLAAPALLRRSRRSRP